MRLLRILLLGGGLGLAAALLMRLGPRELFSLLAGLGWTATAFPPLYALHHVVRTLALKAALAEPAAVPFGRLFLVRLTGEAVQYFTFTGPLLAEPTKAWMLRRQGVTTTDAAGATLTEYLAFTCATSAISFVGLMALRLTVPMPLAMRIPVSATAIGLALLLVFVVIGLRRRWPVARRILARLQRVPGLARRLAVSPAWAAEMEAHVFRNLRDDPARRRRIALYEAAGQAVMLIELWLLLRLLTAAPTVAALFIIEGVTKVSNFVFFFVPVRAGTDEATLVITTGAVGIAAVVGLGVSLVRRARSLLTGAVGLVAAWFLARDGAGGASPGRPRDDEGASR